MLTYHQNSPSIHSQYIKWTFLSKNKQPLCPNLTLMLWFTGIPWNNNGLLFITSTKIYYVNNFNLRSSSTVISLGDEPGHISPCSPFALEWAIRVSFAPNMGCIISWATWVLYILCIHKCALKKVCRGVLRPKVLGVVQGGFDYTKMKVEGKKDKGSVIAS